MTSVRTSAVAAMLAVSAYALPAPPALGAAHPKLVMEELYNVVGETCTEGTETGSYDPVTLAQTYFTPELRQKLEAGVKTGGIDFDVLTDSQDCGVTDINLTFAGFEAAGARGVVQFKNYGEERVVVLTLTRVGQDWRIDDLSYGHRAFSLKTDY